MIETIELTPAITGLGNLHEPALLTVFADTHYRILTGAGSATPREITSKAGEPLYPSIFELRLQIPPQRLIDSHVLWQKFDVGVDVRSFGRQFLEVTGVLGKPGEVPDALEAWTDLALPRVSWSGAWTLTRSDGEHELAMPDAAFMVDIPRLARVPAALAGVRDANTRLGAGPTRPPIHYPVLAGRDAAIGRQMMFSQFVVVMDAAERAFLTDHAFPAFPHDVLDCLATIERRIVFAGNCAAGDVVETHVTAKLARTPGPDPITAPTAMVTSSMELVDVRSRRLLALAETTKVLAIPAKLAGLRHAIDRLFARHGDGTPMGVR